MLVIPLVTITKKINMIKPFTKNYFPYLFLLSFLICSSQEKQNALEKGNVLLADSLASTAICIRCNIYLIDSFYHPIVVEQIKLSVDLKL